MQGLNWALLALLAIGRSNALIGPLDVLSVSAKSPINVPAQNTADSVSHKGCRAIVHEILINDFDRWDASKPAQKVLSPGIYSTF